MKAIEGAREAYVRAEMGVDDGRGGVRALDVVPVSAKYGMNVRKVVALMRGYVEEARRERVVQGEAAQGEAQSGEAQGAEDGGLYAFNEDELELEHDVDEELPVSPPPPTSPSDAVHGDQAYRS